MFQLSKSAQDDWFKSLINQNPYTDASTMDVYHLCFVLGINLILKDKNHEFDELVDPKSTFFNKGWPLAYRSHYDSIIALLIEAEIHRLDYNRDDKNLIKSFVNDLLDNESTTKLSSQGIDLMNKYSYNGFLKLKKELKEKPDDPTDFLIQYNNILNKINN